jgi:general stress protein 26
MVSPVERVWNVADSVGVCMLTTLSGGGFRARPVAARVNRDQALIYVVTDVRSLKTEEIENTPDVGLIFVDAKQNAYLSITGRATVLRDIGKISEVWRKTDDLWWPGGPEDPNVCLLQIAPALAELWDGPASAIVHAFEIAKATLTGHEPHLGENRKVTVRMGAMGGPARTQS